MSPRVEAILPETVGPTVLDVGCTGGLQPDLPQSDSPVWLHRHLSQSFDEVWGIDISTEKIEFLRSQGYERTLVADAQDFNLDKNFTRLRRL